MVALIHKIAASIGVRFGIGNKGQSTKMKNSDVRCGLQDVSIYL